MTFSPSGNGTQRPAVDGDRRGPILTDIGWDGHLAIRTMNNAGLYRSIPAHQQSS